MKKASSSLGSCIESFSEMLEAARGHQMTSDLELRCLDFMEMELGHIIACLMTASHQDVEEGMGGWLLELAHTVSETLGHTTNEADPQHRTQRWQSYWLRSAVEEFYHLAEHPSRYRHLLEEVFRHKLQQLPPLHYGFHYQSNLLITLYMVSMFPYGYKFEKDQFVMKWLSEAGSLDLVTAAKASRYFSDLVDRNVITRAAANSSDNPDEAEAWRWNIDDQAHEFIASCSAKSGFVLTSDTINLAAPSPTSRRLSLYHDDPNIPKLLEKIYLSQTRSLAVSGSVKEVPLDKFVNLVVLDVEGWEHFKDEDLLRACRSKMYFLVYLSIRNTPVSKLPPEIKELCNLEILDASYTQVTELPLGVFVETRLRRLDVRGTPIRKVTLPKQILGLERSLHALLLGGNGMVNSSGTAARLPHDIWRVTWLYTLATVDLSEQPASFIRVLGDLRYLKVIAMTWSFHQSSDREYRHALISSIEKWLNLESLIIHCGLGCSMEFLDSLSDMSSHLKTFKVTLGRFAVFPEWFHRLRHLSFLQITVCKLRTRDLEILRNLPELKVLILGLDSIPKEAIVIKKGFVKLQRFFIHCPVPWLTLEQGAMPNLTYLQLNFRACPWSPDTVPVPSGISKLPSLREVALWYNERYANSSSVKMIVEAVRKNVAECCNATRMVRLFINTTEQASSIN